MGSCIIDVMVGGWTRLGRPTAPWRARLPLRLLLAVGPFGRESLRDPRGVAEGPSLWVRVPPAVGIGSTEPQLQMIGREMEELQFDARLLHPLAKRGFATSTIRGHRAVLR
jgi:hypothetical protein